MTTVAKLFLDRDGDLRAAGLASTVSATVIFIPSSTTWTPGGVYVGGTVEKCKKTLGLEG